MGAIAEPDLTGFLEAQDRLREEAGASVTFHVPVTPKWPAGTKMNPITGEPYDATAKPEGATHQDVVKTCLVILKQGSPLRPQSDTAITEIGEMSGMDIILDVSDQDYADVKTASGMTVNGLLYKIREAKPFSVGGILYRYLVYGDEE